jgi:curved DNA-binding protein CbpA
VRDPYKVLSLHKTATKQQIKAKFYEVSARREVIYLSRPRLFVAPADSSQLSKKTHPDAPGGSADQFHQISEAYDVLGDDRKR